MSYFKAINEFIETPDNTNEVKMTLEDYINFLEEAVFDQYDEEEYSLEEGANLDMLKVYKQCMKDYGKKCKETKKAIRHKDFDSALKNCDELKEIMSKAESELRAIDANSTSTLICGTLASLGMQMILYTISGLYGAGAGSLSAGLSGELLKQNAKDTMLHWVLPASVIAIVIESLYVLYKSFKELKSKKTENPKEAFNQTRQLILEAFRECNKAIDKMKKGIEKKKSKLEK